MLSELISLAPSLSAVVLIYDLFKVNRQSSIIYKKLYLSDTVYLAPQVRLLTQYAPRPGSPIKKTRNSEFVWLPR